MPPVNPKNVALSAAGTDLGLGVQLNEQLLTEEEKRKRLLEAQKNNPANYGDSVLGSASMSLFSGMGK
jgi:hypothetical protein